MRRATTPTHTFTLAGIEMSEISRILITYAQRGEILLEKTEADCGIDGAEVSLTLTQEEANLFNPGCVEIQLRVVTHEGTALASQIFHESVNDVLNDEVL